MVKRLFTTALVVILAAAFLPLFALVGDRDNVTLLAQEYLEDGPDTLGGANVVTSVIVTYRGLDTLGEVTVLFAASTGVALVFSRLGGSSPRGSKGDRIGEGGSRAALSGGSQPIQNYPPSELVVTGAGLLLPLILVLGVFIFVHGHLTPGGGFQGGVVIAGGVLLALLAGTLTELSHRLLSILEILAGTGYVAVGLMGLWLAGGFLDPRFLPNGEIGSLFSAGAIPIIYILVGIKVGSELSNVIDAMRSRRVTE